MAELQYSSFCPIDFWVAVVIMIIYLTYMYQIEWRKKKWLLMNYCSISMVSTALKISWNIQLQKVFIC